MSRSVRINSTLGLAALVLCGLLLPSSAGAASTFCSPSGDFCIRIARDGGSPVFSIGTFAHRGRYTLCVTAPDSSRVCKRFLLTPEVHDLFGSHVRWSRHFPDKGSGTYRVRWRQSGTNLGPRLSFRSGPTMHLRPRSVEAGGTVRVFGSAQGCAAGNQLVLLSEAFSRRDEFAGVPAVSTPVLADGRYHARIRIPRGRRPGDYVISGRCGGGNLGIRRTLRVQ
jgi:hypothetical protein